MKRLFCACLVALFANLVPASGAQWATYPGAPGVGQGKHIVLVSGDEEYRSEECLPMLGKILAQHHGFRCTVLFSLNPADGTIDPVNQTNVVGLQNLDKADMMVMFLRFRELPDDQMRYVVDFVNSGKPVLAIRTSTHAFSYSRNRQSPYAKWDWQNKEWAGGFGQQVLGETWVSHHGEHGKESTRGVVNSQHRSHPILKGVTDIWGPTDVYTVSHLPADAQVLVYGQVLTGMNPGDKALEGPKNNPMMPIIWTREYRGELGKVSKIVCSTIGSAVDFQSEDLRRVVVNGCYWSLGLEKQIPAKAKVDYVGEYSPTYFGFAKHRKGVKPEDLELK
jgi:type 1 glutamine amidotransferase